MNGMRKHIAIAAALASAATIGFAAPASAQATRTWVSGVGDDVNPCSRTAPCKTFAGAISKTAAGGEINCLDPGGFGAVSIIKSMTISCPYTEGGALAGGNGVTVNMPATTDVTFLRGLDIFGVNPPSNGVRFINNGTLHIEDCTIRRFNAVNSAGVSIAPTGSGAKVFISNSTIAENGNGATGGGIVIAPGVGGNVFVVLTNVRVRDNANNGLRADGASGFVGMAIENSDFSGNVNGVSLGGAGSNTIAMINNSLISNNSGTGLLTSGASAVIRVDNSSIVGNNTGVNALAGSAIFSYGHNRLDANPTNVAANNGTFTGAVILEK